MRGCGVLRHLLIRTRLPGSGCCRARHFSESMRRAIKARCSRLVARARVRAVGSVAPAAPGAASGRGIIDRARPRVVCAAAHRTGCTTAAPSKRFGSASHRTPCYCAARIVLSCPLLQLGVPSLRSGGPPRRDIPLSSSRPRASPSFRTARLSGHARHSRRANGDASNDKPPNAAS